MSKYLLKNIATDMYAIHCARAKIGFVRKVKAEGERKGQFIASINQQEPSFGATASEAFHAAVAVANRILLCGEDDADKAREVLAARNAQVVQQANEFNASLGYRAMRVRRSGVRI